jgi:hypothetical protein
MLKPKSKIKKHIKNDIKAKIQDKEVKLKLMCKCQSQNPGQESTLEMMLRQRSKIRK